MPSTKTLTPASYLRSIRAMPQPSRALAYGLPLAWLFAFTGFLIGLLFDLDGSWLMWFILPFPLIAAAVGLVVALNIRGNAAGVKDAMGEQGMPTISLPFYRVFTAVSSAVALGVAVTIVMQDF